MTHIESLPLDIPPDINEGTGAWEHFGILGYEATRSLITRGASPFLRGSRLTRMLLSPSQRSRFDEVRKQVRYSQRMVPVSHFAPAADPDTEKPVDNQIELKLPVPIEAFAHVAQGLRASMRIPTNDKMLDVPCYLHPEASAKLKSSYEALKPRVRINWTEGTVPNRKMPYAGIQLEVDWVGAGSTHITKLPLSYWRVYPTGEDTDMRNPKNCTNVDGLWGKIFHRNGILEVQVPETPTAVFLPDSAIELHERSLSNGTDIQAAINVTDMLTRGLRIGAALGIQFTPEHTRIASKWMKKASPLLWSHPPDQVIRKYIHMNIKAALAYDPQITEEFLKRVNFTAIAS